MFAAQCTRDSLPPSRRNNETTLTRELVSTVEETREIERVGGVCVWNHVGCLVTGCAVGPQTRARPPREWRASGGHRGRQAPRNSIPLTIDDDVCRPNDLPPVEQVSSEERRGTRTLPLPGHFTLTDTSADNQLNSRTTALYCLRLLTG